MKFFVDTADVNEIRELNELGLLDGVTTNPSLIMKSGGKISEVTRQICEIVDGPVSAEVTATEYGEMMKQADFLSKIADNICIKVPLTLDGLKACRALTGDGRKVNVTLCFSANQALLAAKAGATFISPFIGRIDDMAVDGMDLIREIRVDLRQLRLRHRDPRRLDPHRQPRQGGGDHRRRRRHRAAGDAQGAGQASADRQGPGDLPRRLEEDRPDDWLDSGKDLWPARLPGPPPVPSRHRPERCSAVAGMVERTLELPVRHGPDRRAGHLDQLAAIADELLSHAATVPCARITMPKRSRGSSGSARRSSSSKYGKLFSFSFMKRSAEKSSMANPTESNRVIWSAVAAPAMAAADRPPTIP